MESKTTLVCSGVRFTKKSVAQLDGTRVSVSIARDSIRQMSLRYGFQSERPLLQVLFGSILCLVGLWPVIHITNWLIFGGVFLALETLLIFFLIFGIWGIYTGVRRGYYLLVEMDRDTRKLAFSSPVAREDIEAFLAEARTAFGYDIAE